MYIQAPDGLIINCAHVMKIRKIDHVLENGDSQPYIWMKYVTGEEEKLSFETKELRAEWYGKLKTVLQLESF